MRRALALAHEAQVHGEVPVGALVVADGAIIGEGWNRPIGSNDPTAHAEIVALRAAAKAIGNYRMPGTTLYVTLEPCPMCAGAIVHCRPDRVVFGCPDEKGGAAGGWINLLDANPPLNHRCDTLSGVMGEESLHLLQTFFREAREKKKAEKLLEGGQET